LYIDGRGKADREIKDYADDYQNLQVLKEKIFSGNGT